MAAAHMQRPTYPPLQGYSPHANSPAPGPSPHHHDGRGMYQPPPQMPMYPYQYSGMNMHHQAYPQHPQQAPQAQQQQHPQHSQHPQQHHQNMPSHSMLMSHPNQSPLHSHQQIPPPTHQQQQHQQQQQQHQQHAQHPQHPQHSQHQSHQQHQPQQHHQQPGMSNSPRTKIESGNMPQANMQQANMQQSGMHQPPMQQQQQQRPMDPAGLQRPGSAVNNAHNVPASTSSNGSTPLAPNAPNSAGGPNSNAAPGPIPATTPLVVKQDNNGVQWIAFEYSRDRVKMEYTIRCDVESVNTEALSNDFKTENCVYPRACCSKDQYRGNRLQYETECNAVGWALAELNACLRGKRGLIQRAVDSWRNSNADPKLRSRRVRRQAKMQTRTKQQQQQGQQPAQQHPGSHMPVSIPPHTAASLAASNPAQVTPLQRQAPMSMGSMGTHHPQANGHTEDVSVGSMFQHM